VSELVRRRLLEEEPTAYRFSHDKVRQVAYMDIAEAERRRLHRHAGEALEALRPEQIEPLAFHFDRGGIREKALTYTLQAGERAQAVYDYKAALAHYRRGGELVGDDPLARWDVLAQQDEVLYTLSRWDAQAEVLDEMLRLAEAMDDPVRLARALYLAGRRENDAGDPCQALALLEEALPLARVSEEHKLVGKGLTKISSVYWRLGDIGRCQAAAEEALAVFRKIGDREGERMALNALVALHQGLTGDYGQALALGEESRRIARELGNAYEEAIDLGNSALARARLGDYHTAQQALAEALAFIIRAGDRFVEGAFFMFQSINHLGIGDLEKARQSALRALEVCRQVGNPNFEIEALGKLGLIALDQGDPQQARDWFEQAAVVGEAHTQMLDRAEQLSHLALAESRLGNHERALRLSAQALGVMEEGHHVSNRLKTAYFERAQIVNAAQGFQAARPHLERAYQLLVIVADRISDPDLRRSFLENVAENRAIVAAHRLGYLPTRLRKQNVRLPVVGIPTGRPLHDDEWVEITWTVTAPEDEAVLGKAARRQHRLLRLLREAKEQDATPTVDDLADALEVSRATIKRDLAALRRAGHEVRTRGSRNR
jgi:tetratricopeptide (TPR) repeat protein